MYSCAVDYLQSGDQAIYTIAKQKLIARLNKLHFKEPKIVTSVGRLLHSDEGTSVPINRHHDYLASVYKLSF